jgi:large subunit ribosomal protein L15
MAELNNLRRPEGSHRDRKRRGRGPGSGSGKTAGRGHKGAKARTGSGGPGGGKPNFEGGQMPLHRRLPKRGFTPLNRIEYQVVNLYQLEQLEEAEITPETLKGRGLIGDTRQPVKVLATGELRRNISISAHAFSKAAREKIESAGGRIVELA